MHADFTGHNPTANDYPLAVHVTQRSRQAIVPRHPFAFAGGNGHDGSESGQIRSSTSSFQQQLLSDLGDFRELHADEVDDYFERYVSEFVIKNI